MRFAVDARGKIVALKSPSGTLSGKRADGKSVRRPLWWE